MAVVSILSNAKECVKPQDLSKYYFINGVGNTKRTILLSSIALERSLNLQDTVTSLKNPRNLGSGQEIFPGFLNTKAIPTFGEIKEVFSQKMAELSKEDEAIDEATIKEMFSQLSEDKHNIIFSHSQGNLYANALCDYNNNKKKQVNIGIASPASVAKCGNQYVTLKEDSVINILRVTHTAAFSPLKDPLKWNSSISRSGLCKDTLWFCHGLNEVYLQEEEPLAQIKALHKATLDKIIDEELNFNIVELQLKEVKQDDKNILVSSYESISEFKSSTEMSIRRTIASVKTLSYLADVANSSFITSLTKMSLNKLSKKEFNKLLDTEIKVESDQEYADVVGFVFDTVKGYCLKYPKFVPQKMQGYCQSARDYYYYESKKYEDSSDFKRYTIKSKGMTATKDNSLSINCKDVQGKENTSEDIALDYAPESAKIVTLSLNDFTYDIYPKNLLNKIKETAAIAKLSITYQDNKYQYKLDQLEKKINYVTMDENNQDYLRCNSINKLLSNNCKGYFLSLLSKSK